MAKQERDGLFRNYKITNNVNNKIYVGYTTQTLEERFQQHTKIALNDDGPHYKLHLAMRKYGIENFTIEELFVSDDLNLVKVMEGSLIKALGTKQNEKGYNMCFGANNYDPLEKQKKEKVKSKPRIRKRNTGQGKYPRGENHWKTKEAGLTDETARMILKIIPELEGYDQKKLADELGISEGTISNIVNRKGRFKTL